MRIKTHLAVLILILLGVSVMANQVTQPFILIQSPVSLAQEEQDSPAQNEEPTYFVQSNLAISSISSITLEQEFYQIREIILNEETDTQNIHFVDGLGEGNNFRRLFRPVISPNAP